MFDNIFAAIEKWMRELLTGMVESNMSTMFTDVNEKTSEIAAQVGRTPQNWNSSVFSMIQNLSESVVVPIAGIIITLVLCYELISMLTERNNLHKKKNTRLGERIQEIFSTRRVFHSAGMCLLESEGFYPCGQVGFAGIGIEHLTMQQFCTGAARSKLFIGLAHIATTGSGEWNNGFIL